MADFSRALETSILLAEKVAHARPPSDDLRARAALADFAAFGLFKRAAIDPAALASLQRGLGWGVGLGLPALGAGHLLLRDARAQSADVLRDARNQALMTAAGIGGMEALGGMLKRPAPAAQQPAPDLSIDQKLAAAIMVDDVLEAACDQLGEPTTKHAALVELIRHRVEGSRVLRSLLA